MKLYKFRPLETCDDLLRVEDILNTGKFWFSSLWEQNDSLEGVYLSDLTGDNGVFSGKDQFKICSFSFKKGLRQPLLWAHYANGFKGVAIEVEIGNRDEFKRVKYNNNPVGEEIGDSKRDKISAIISHKTKAWAYESEYRCLKKMESPGRADVGKITGVCFGSPFKALLNKGQVFAACRKLQTYQRLRNCLEATASGLGFALSEAHLETGNGKRPKVIIEPSLRGVPQN